MRTSAVSFLVAALAAVGPVTVAAAPASIDGSAQATAQAERLNTQALGVLATIPVEDEQPDGYDRDLFDHWISQGNSCDTRDRVLIEESRTPAQVQYPGCNVAAGDWFSVYDGLITANPRDLDIDHVVALKEAWDSGAHSWSADRRRAFANDLTDDRSLTAVSASSNRSKGARDPSEWLPPRSEAVCIYLSDWIAVKARWSLSMDLSEHDQIHNELTDRCPNQPIAAWPEPPET